MNDCRMIKLDADDFETIMFALEVAAKAAGDHRGSVACDFNEVADDIREQWYRNDDEWGWPEEPTDIDGSLIGRTVRVAEEDFINAGILARETMKEQQSEVHRPFADSDPRTARLMQGTVTAFISNDPIDW